MNKKQLAAEQMKECLIESAIEIVGTSGLDKLTASALSKYAGVSKGGLYHHFEGLDSLKIAAFQSLVEGFLSVDNSSQQYSSLEDYLLQIGEQTFEVMEQRPIELKALMAFIQQAMYEEEFKKGVTLLTRNSLNNYSEKVSTHFPSLKAEQISTIVQILDAHFGGAMIHWFLLNNPDECRKNWRNLCKIICFSLEKGAL